MLKRVAGPARWIWKRRTAGAFLLVVGVGWFFYLAVAHGWLNKDALSTAADAAAAVGAGLAVFAAFRSSSESAEAAKKASRALALARRPTLRVDLITDSDGTALLRLWVSDDQPDVTQIDMTFVTTDGRVITQPSVARAQANSTVYLRLGSPSDIGIAGAFAEYDGLGLPVGARWTVSLLDEDHLGHWLLTSDDPASPRLIGA